MDQDLTTKDGVNMEQKRHPRGFLVDKPFSSSFELERNSNHAVFQQRITVHRDKLIIFSSFGRFRRIKNEIIALKHYLF